MAVVVAAVVIVGVVVGIVVVLVDVAVVRLCDTADCGTTEGRQLQSPV